MEKRIFLWFSHKIGNFWGLGVEDVPLAYSALRHGLGVNKPYTSYNGRGRGNKQYMINLSLIKLGNFPAELWVRSKLASGSREQLKKLLQIYHHFSNYNFHFLKPFKLLKWVVIIAISGDPWSEVKTNMLCISFSPLKRSWQSQA